MINDKVIGGILLVAGTCIGVAMLALPVSTAPAGFLYSAILVGICWVFMYWTGLLVLEVYLPLQNKEPSYVSMSGETLGVPGKVVTWICFIVLLYSLVVAHLIAGSDFLSHAIETIFSRQLPSSVGQILLALIFFCVVFSGVRVADYVNRFFFTGLVVSFIALLVIAAPHVTTSFLTLGDPKYLLAALPIVFTALGFHIIVPSLCMYLDGNPIKIKRVIFWGSLLPLLVYLIWEVVIFGMIPMQGPNGLISILHSGHASTEITKALLLRTQSNSLGFFTALFSFFAIISSFVGVAYGLFDLLADGLQFNKHQLKSRFPVALLTMFPPLVFALTYPQGFFYALTYAGICVAIVHGLLPVMMAYSGRYVKPWTQPYRLHGGKGLLLVITMFFLIVIAVDLMR